MKRTDNILSIQVNLKECKAVFVLRVFSSTRGTLYPVVF